MKYWLPIVVLCAACGSTPAIPTRTYRAQLSVSPVTVGACADLRCQYSVVVTNAGPDCATRVSVATTLIEPPRVLMAVGIAVGQVRANTSVLATGTDWPRAGINPDTFVTGDPIACQ